MTVARITYPSHGGLANPDWKYRTHADLRNDFYSVHKPVRQVAVVRRLPTLVVNTVSEVRPCTA